MNIQDSPNYIITPKFSIKLLLTIIALTFLLPQSFSNSIQIAHCKYQHDSENRYTCRLSNSNLSAAVETLEIIGDHLPGYSDYDVLVLDNHNSKVNTFNGEFLRIFRNLQFLSLRNADITTITSDAFNYCNLRELSFANNKINGLPSNLLDNCENLRAFDVSNNKIQELHNDLFGTTSNLEIFNAEYSQLSSLPEDIFQNMPNLKVLNIARNSITYLSPNLLRNSRSLEEFYFNSPTKLEDQQNMKGILNGQTNLRIFSFENPVNSFDFEFLAQFQKLKQFNIKTYLLLKGIAWQSLPSSLTHLLVEKIGEDLPEDAFHGLSNLTNLELSGIGMTKLYPNSFAALANLKFLRIYETNIKTLYPEQFSSQSKLQYLHLSQSYIEELPEGIFVPLVNIGMEYRLLGIDLSKNKITRLNSNIFGTHPFLGEVNFESNKIDKIERGTFNSRRMPMLKYLLLLSNSCISYIFMDETNLDENERLEWCYNNWDGITTTTPNSVRNNWRNFEIIGLIFIGLLMLSMKN